MSELVLFHSALGLRRGVHVVADRLRAARHTVHVPDYYDGKVFDNLADGIAYRDELGIPEIGRRATEFVADLPEQLVYAGFSLGAGPAQLLAQTRSGAQGALLLHGVLPSAFFGTPWPAAVPLAVHIAANDPFVDIEVAEAVVAEAANGQLYRYENAGHLFLDPDLPDYDETAATLALQRILAFLAA
jgi:dienelactone hydrolase